MSPESATEEIQRLRAQVRELEARIREPEEIVRAIREDEVDAVVVAADGGERIYSLRPAEVLYRGLVEEMREGAVVIDASGRVVYVNPCLAAILGVERGEVLGLPIARFLAERSRPVLEAMRADPGPGAHEELELHGPGGELVPVVASIHTIALDGETVAGMILTDLRDQRRRQELLAESKRKDEFLAMLAHELRNPLAPIRNALGLLETGDLSRETLDWSLQVIHRQVGHLVRMLDDLLDLQRFAHGVIQLEMHVLDLGALVEQAVQAAHGALTAKSQSARVVPADRPLLVLGDAARLTQVLSNLLINAIKYSPPHTQVTVTCARDGDQALLRVADRGIGMSEDLLAHAFDPFVQGDRDLSRSQGGLGLGLTLVRRLVELHGGSVSASSAGPGLGTELVVRLPLAKLADREVERPRAPERAIGMPRRILVVDDNEDSARTLCALLELCGHRARMAFDGAEALRLVEQSAPDVVILDIGLPGMDGYAVAGRMRAMASLAGCRLVALSGYGRTEDRNRSRAAGFSAHLVKPVEIEQLLDAIECQASRGAKGS